MITTGLEALSTYFILVGINSATFTSFIFSYLSMEEWMHTVNTKEKVRSAGKLVGQVLHSLKRSSPEQKANVS